MTEQLGPKRESKTQHDLRKLAKALIMLAEQSDESRPKTPKKKAS